MAYTEEQIERAKELILDKLSEGESLKNTLEENNSLPSRPIVYQWLNEEHKDYDKEFLNNYAQAREDSGDLDAENIEDIAHKTLKGEYEPPAARVAIDAFKWTAARKKPKKYGDASLLKLANPDGTELKINAIFPNDGLYVPSDDSLRKDKSTKKDD